MRLIDIPAFLLPFILATEALADSPRFPVPRGVPRDLDAVLIEPAPSPSPAPTPFLKYLDLRQLAVAQPAAAPAAPAPAAPAVAPAVAPAAAPIAPAAPVAGVGGAGAAPAAPQPTPGAQANPVTTIIVNTIVGGVTKQVPQVFTQIFGAIPSSPPVQSGEIGLGTLTGKVGVVKTHDAKSDAVAIGRNIAWGNVAVVLVAGVAALGGGVLGIARI